MKTKIMKMIKSTMKIKSRTRVRTDERKLSVPRYFLAIPLPDEAKDRLVAVQPTAVHGIRLIDRHELHLTLLFLGEVAPQLKESLLMALANVQANAFCDHN